MLATLLRTTITRDMDELLELGSSVYTRIHIAETAIFDLEHYEAESSRRRVAYARERIHNSVLRLSHFLGTRPYRRLLVQYGNPARILRELVDAQAESNDPVQDIRTIKQVMDILMAQLQAGGPELSYRFANLVEKIKHPTL